MIEFRCPSCSATLQVEDEYAGQPGQCPECAAALAVPEAQATAADPAPLRSQGSAAPEEAPAPAAPPAAPPVEPGWHYAVGQQRQGPLNRAAMEQRIRLGQVRGDMLVWRAGMPSWVPAASVPELQGPLWDANANYVAQYGPQWRQSIPGRGRAIASLVLGILSLVFFCLWPLSAPLGIVGLILGLTALKPGVRGQAITGAVLCGVGLLVTVGFLVFMGIAANNGWISLP